MLRILASSFLLLSATVFQAKDSVIPGMPDVLTSGVISHKFDLRTDGLLWAAAIPNIGMDYQLTNKISIGGEIMWCPWFVSDRHALRIFGFRPSMRWWLKEFGGGSYISPHISVAWYNLKYGDYRYQDHSQPALGAGVSYGYTWRLNHRISLDFSCGIGFLSLRYDRFYNIANGMAIDKRQTSYFGIDHLGVSFVYNLNN